MIDSYLKYSNMGGKVILAKRYKHCQRPTDSTKITLTLKKAYQKYFYIKYNYHNYIVIFYAFAFTAFINQIYIMCI